MLSAGRVCGMAPAGGVQGVRGMVCGGLMWSVGFRV